MSNTFILENTFGKLTSFVDTNGMAWFNARDVLKILGLSRNTISRVDRDDRMDNVFEIPGNTQKASAVNEPGLYTLVLASRKPEAKEFKHWITHDVLPSIRKNGGYISGQENLQGDELKEVQTQVRELSEKVAKLTAGKAKLASYLTAEEDRSMANFEMYRVEHEKREAAEDALKKFGDIVFVQKHLDALREANAIGEEEYAAIMEAYKQQKREYENSVACRPPERDPLGYDKSGVVMRRSEFVSVDSDMFEHDNL